MGFSPFLPLLLVLGAALLAGPLVEPCHCLAIGTKERYEVSLTTFITTTSANGSGSLDTLAMIKDSKRILADLIPTESKPVDDCSPQKYNLLFGKFFDESPQKIFTATAGELNYPLTKPLGQKACDDLGQDAQDQVLHLWGEMKCLRYQGSKKEVLAQELSPYGLKFDQHLTCKQGKYVTQPYAIWPLPVDDGARPAASN